MADEHDDRTVIRLGIGPGTRLNGIYEIERLIAVGGMGEVYRGRAIQTGDAVAIKTIRPELARNEAALTLFRKEAAALHNLHHEAIVRYYVFSIDPDLGAPYLAMEYVDGQPLSEVLKQGPLSFEAVQILQRRLAGGLEAAHELGIVHRDVSPDNVILPAGNPGRAKIIDFGIARSTVLGEGTVIGGGFAGKYAYVSPEQLGLFGGAVTPKSDIYSLGLILAQALTGRPLDMGGSQVEVVEKRRKLPDLSGLDRRLRPLIERMLQPNPSDRIASMAQVTAWQPQERAPARKRITLAISGLVAAAAIAGVLAIPKLIGPGTSDPPRTSDLPALTPLGSSGTVVGNPSDLPIPPLTSPGPSSQQPLAPESSPSQPPNPSTGPQDPSTGRQSAQANVPVVIPRTDQPIEPAALAPADRLARYVRDYEGGNCFFLRPITLEASVASLEGFGPSAATFEAFDEAFKRANKFEAQINVRLVTDAQCPAVSFMRKVGFDATRAPNLQIASFRLRETEPLSGTIENQVDRHVDVLLVSDEGYVYNLADYTKRDRGVAKFELRLDVISGQRPKPLIVLAIASEQPLSLLGTGKPMRADEVFPLLLDEARHRNMTLDLAVKYLRLEG